MLRTRYRVEYYEILCGADVSIKNEKIIFYLTVRGNRDIIQTCRTRAGITARVAREETLISGGGRVGEGV